MLYFFDTEFLEDGVTVEPISIGICAEDGRELYLEFEYDENRVNESEFLRNNVVPHLTGTEKISRSEVAERVLEFIGGDEEPQFWAWYAAYDWIVMCQLFGRMVDLPKHFPKFVRDLRQICAEKGIQRSLLPKTPEKAHNALEDARWLKSAYGIVIDTVNKQTERQLAKLRDECDILRRHVCDMRVAYWEARGEPPSSLWATAASLYGASTAARLYPKDTLDNNHNPAVTNSKNAQRMFVNFYVQMPGTGTVVWEVTSATGKERISMDGSKWIWHSTYEFECLYGEIARVSDDFNDTFTGEILVVAVQPVLAQVPTDDQLVNLAKANPEHLIDLLHSRLPTGSLARCASAAYFIEDRKLARNSLICLGKSHESKLVREACLQGLNGDLDPLVFEFLEEIRNSDSDSAIREIAKEMLEEF